MVPTFFGVISIREFWKKQYPEEDYIGIKLIIGLFGLFISFWAFNMSILMRFSVDFLLSIEYPVPQYLYFLTSFGVQIIFGVIISGIVLAITLNQAQIFEDYDLRKNYFIMRKDILDALTKKEDQYQDWRYNLILFIMVINGLIAGFLYTLLYFVPLFVIFFISAITFSNFINTSPPLFIISATFAWILTSIYVIRQKLDLKEREVKPKPVIQRFTKRDVEILSSDEEPIICSNCRSFIPADSEVCPVCSEDVVAYNP